MTAERKNGYQILLLVVKVIAPMLRERLKKCYSKISCATLEDFLNDFGTMKLLFDSFARRNICHHISGNLNLSRSKKSAVLPYPLNEIYRESTSKQCGQNNQCTCKYEAKGVTEEELDITMLSLILLNCCQLSKIDILAVKAFRHFKNKYVSHHPTMEISDSEFKTKWTHALYHITSFNSFYIQQSELLKEQPFDEILLQKYYTDLCNAQETRAEMKAMFDVIMQKMDEIKTSVSGGKRKRDDQSEPEKDCYFKKKPLHKNRDEPLILNKFPAHLSNDTGLLIINRSKAEIISYAVSAKTANEDIHICGNCKAYYSNLEHFVQHKLKCLENLKVKNEYKKTIAAKIKVRIEDTYITESIVSDWVTKIINPSYHGLEIQHIESGCILLWLKVDLTLYLDHERFYRSVDDLIKCISAKYTNDLPTYNIQILDVTTGYFDNPFDTLQCGNCKLVFSTLDDFTSHKSIRCSTDQTYHSSTCPFTHETDLKVLRDIVQKTSNVSLSKEKIKYTVHKDSDMDFESSVSVFGIPNINTTTGSCHDHDKVDSDKSFNGQFKTNDTLFSTVRQEPSMNLENNVDVLNHEKTNTLAKPNDDYAEKDNSQCREKALLITKGLIHKDSDMDFESGVNVFGIPNINTTTGSCHDHGKGDSDKSFNGQFKTNGDYLCTYRSPSADENITVVGLGIAADDSWRIWEIIDEHSKRLDEHLKRIDEHLKRNAGDFKTPLERNYQHHAIYALDVDEHLKRNAGDFKTLDGDFEIHLEESSRRLSNETIKLLFKKPYISLIARNENERCMLAETISKRFSTFETIRVCSIKEILTKHRKFLKQIFIVDDPESNDLRWRKWLPAVRRKLGKTTKLVLTSETRELSITENHSILTNNISANNTVGRNSYESNKTGKKSVANQFSCASYLKFCTACGRNNSEFGEFETIHCDLCCKQSGCLKRSAISTIRQDMSFSQPYLTDLDCTHSTKIVRLPHEDRNQSLDGVTDSNFHVDNNIQFVPSGKIGSMRNTTSKGTIDKNQILPRYNNLEHLNGLSNRQSMTILCEDGNKTIDGQCLAKCFPCEGEMKCVPLRDGLRSQNDILNETMDEKTFVTAHFNTDNLACTQRVRTAPLRQEINIQIIDDQEYVYPYHGSDMAGNDEHGLLEDNSKE